GISASATSLTVNSGTGSLFPAPSAGVSFFKLTLIDAATGQLTEIMHVTARTGDTMTIDRGQEGTTARAWSANDIAANMMTAGTLSYLLTNFQPLDQTLTAIAALVGEANKLPYFNGPDTAALADLTAVGRDIISKDTTSDLLTYLGLGDALNALIKSKNLSDVADKVLARKNLIVPSGVDAQMCRAWGSFNGITGDIIASYNVASITKNSTGSYTVNFTNNLSSNLYAAPCSAYNTGAGASALARVAGSAAKKVSGFGIAIFDNTTDTQSDSSTVDFSVFGGN
ncbi:hypothetical protein ABK716_29335, partial [Enterobacter kobei]